MSNTTTKGRISTKKTQCGFHYKIQSEGERKEVKWLISQGDFTSVKDYEETMTKIATGKKKPVS